jgi:uncharacterized glyoxalase superfamily protein PhnB
VPGSDNDRMSTKAAIVPCLRYQDAPKAIEWLCTVFGFEKHLVVPGDNGGIAHAQLTLGNGMIMLGGGAQSAYADLVKVPTEVNGYNTQSTYVVVADVDAHYARAKSGGAQIVIDIKNEDYGGRDYTCKDLEGHVWSFGSYDPWA